MFLVLLILIFPIIICGILLVRRTTSLSRIELIIPSGAILGFVTFTFILNSLSFLIKGGLGIMLSYVFVICLAVFLNKFIKSTDEKISPLENKQLFLYIICIFFWSGLIFWKANYALIGSDTNLYYAVAQTFLRGNFPPQTPWQPDLPLSYHLGTFELLAAFKYFTNLSWQFLHLFFASIFIICGVQIVIWIWGRPASIYSFIIANLAATVSFISFGFFYWIWPDIPLELPDITDIRQFVLWTRNLPTVEQAIEVYGAPINLDALIYFIFHAFGLVIFLTLIVIIIYSKGKILSEWAILLIGIITLALVNESIFIAVSPSLIIAKLILQYQDKKLFNHWKIICFLILITGLVIFNQNSIITSNLLTKKEIEPSIILFPTQEQIKEDFKSYHYYQQISKQLERREEWLPFNWTHIGLDILITLSIVSITFIKFSEKQKIIILTLFLSGIFSLMGYHFIVPKFLIANGNRFLGFSFIFLSLTVIYCFYSLVEILKNNKLKVIYIFSIFLAIWIFLPTILPPLTYLSKNRFGESKLVPRAEQVSEGIKWIRENLPFETRVMVLDARTPHPSGVARILTGAGVFSPIFPSDFRAYTIEASPEYLDIAYSLSPQALNKLGITTLLIDSYFFNTLPEIRKQQLLDLQYFENIFTKEYEDRSWEQVFIIKEKYLASVSELEGVINKLPSYINSNSKVYIDSEENFDPSYLRRALIFILRDKNIFYLPQSGVYLNVEVNIPTPSLRNEKDYDYLVLSKSTDPAFICACHPKLVWKGLKGEIFLWEK